MKSPYLRQFPGKRRFERVSEDDWNAPLPHKDIAGYGHILRLEADVRVMSPCGDLVVARKWPSRSYIRNFARLLRNMFGSPTQFVDVFANLYTTPLDSGVSNGLIPALSSFISAPGTPQNPDLAGAGMAIGQAFSWPITRGTISLRASAGFIPPDRMCGRRFRRHRP